MNRAVPLNRVKDLERIAFDLSSTLEHKGNIDISEEFPTTFAQYTGDIKEVARNLEVAQGCFKVGKREQFIIFAGEKAVGLSTVINNINTPNGVDPSWPNLSGFVCHPFRGQGLGRLSLETRMQSVINNFGKNAWTLVKQGNVHSEHLVTSVGFKKSELVADGWGKRDLYVFDSDTTQQV